MLKMTRITNWTLQKLGEGTTEEMSLKAFPENSQSWRRRDVLQQNVLQPGNGDQKSLVADG